MKRPTQLKQSKPKVEAVEPEERKLEDEDDDINVPRIDKKQEENDKDF